MEKNTGKISEKWEPWMLVQSDSHWSANQISQVIATKFLKKNCTFTYLNLLVARRQAPPPPPTPKDKKSRS